MAKKKSTPHQALKPAREAFSQLENRLNTVMCSLACIQDALQASSAVDTCDHASRAQIVLRHNVCELESLHSDMDQFSGAYLRVVAA